MNPKAPEKVTILHHDQDFIVFNKSANSIVVYEPSIQIASLQQQAEASLKKKLFPVHRLDRVTTGCCILASNNKGLKYLEQAFYKHRVEKFYICFVEGEVDFNKQMVQAPLLRVNAEKKKKGAQAWQEISNKGKSAQTHLRLLWKGSGKSLILARPKTGRMHQIRAHLSHIGHPILGDRLYQARDKHFIKAHQIALHALAISLTSIKGSHLFIHAPLSEQWLAFGETIGVHWHKVEEVIKSQQQRIAQLNKN